MNRDSVDKEWWPILEKYHSDTSSSAPAAADTSAHPVTAPIPVIGSQPVARTTAKPAAAAPIPAQAPKPAPKPESKEAAETVEEDKVTPLRGLPKTLAANMDESLTVPTATSVRTVPAKLMIDNRIVINNHMARTRGGKISFTHLIGWALIRTLDEFRSQNVFYARDRRQALGRRPGARQPRHRDRPAQARRNSRSHGAQHQARRHAVLHRVPQAPTKTWSPAARGNKLTAADFQGTTVSR